jgi:hypothetical protein
LTLIKKKIRVRLFVETLKEGAHKLL